MTEDPTSARVKTNRHVFLLDGEAPRAPGLRASRCRACGSYSLGRVMACNHCLARDLDEIAAGQRASLTEFAIAEHPANGFDAPYGIGMVSTDEGLSLFSPLVGDLDGLQRGMPLRFVLLPRGDRHVTFAYAALQEAIS